MFFNIIVILTGHALLLLAWYVNVSYFLSHRHMDSFQPSDSPLYHM